VLTTCSLVPPSSLQLRAYAEYRGRPQRWDEHNKGFIVEGDSYTTVLVIITTLTLQIWFQFYLAKKFFEIVNQCFEQDTPWRLFVWSAGDVLLASDVILLVLDVITLILITQNGSGSVGSVFFTLLNIISFIMVLLFSVCYAVDGWRCAHHFPRVPVLCLPHRMRYCLLFLSYVTCANIFARSAIPTLLLVMVFPLESISAIALGCFVFLVFAMFVLLFRSRTEKDCSSFCYLLICVFLITFVVAMYVSILFFGSGTDKYFQPILPSLGSAVVGYWMKKFFDEKMMNKKS